MSRFELVVPDLEATPAAIASLQIDPDELAAIGHDMAIDPTVYKPTLKVTDPSGLFHRWEPRGFVEPLSRPGKPSVYIRGLLPIERLVDSYFATVPNHDSGLLTAHMHWHAAELRRLEEAGATIPTYFPIFLRDHEKWGSRSVVLMAVADVPGEDNAQRKHNRAPGAEETIRQVARILLRYYTDPNRSSGENVIGDQAPPRQFVGVVTRDLDPLRSKGSVELYRLRHEALSFGSSPETTQLFWELTAAEQQAKEIEAAHNIQNTNS